MSALDSAEIHVNSRRKLPPTPPGHFLLGHVQGYRADTLGYERHLARTYGDVVHVRFVNRQAYLMSGPEDVKQVLVDQADKFYKAPAYRQVLSRFLGNGLLTSDGDFWRRQRKLSQPAFHHKRIQTYAEIMINDTVRMLDRWQVGEVRNINQDMMRLTLSIVSKALFSADVDGAAHKVGEALTMLLQVSDEAMQSLLMSYPDWIPTARNRRFKLAVDMLDEVIMGIINDRRRSNEDNGDLLSMLLVAQDEDGTRMTDRQLRDEAVTIVLAGHETTANALTWAWYLLSQHPEVEAKLHEELDTVLGGRLPTLEDLRQLPYTEKVIKETMRLYPPIPTIARQAIEDVQIGEYRVPKGMIVLIAPHVIHRDPRWFADPEVFMPERWTSDMEKSLPKFAYLPFAGGPRICIGNSFAQMEANLLLATIAQRYDLQLEPGQHVEPEAVLTLRPAENIHMRLVERQSQTLAVN
jgi:cytochrome P450